jgi:DNA-binding MarR family transcriptional regulator
MPQKTLKTVVAQFGHAIGLLVHGPHSAGGSRALSRTEGAIMARLARDGPATIADLAHAEGMRSESMAATITALEEMGIVQHKPHPTDGRQLNIELTTKGAAVQRGPETSAIRPTGRVHVRARYGSHADHRA